MGFPSPNIEGSQIISGNYANLKSKYVLVTMRTQMEKGMVATNHWLTWLYNDYQRDPVDRILNPRYRPIITVLHEDIFLHRHSENECAKLFDQILKWERTSSTPQDLKNQVALLRFMFAQAMPFMRGSAAIGEWLEGAIYRHHGFKCSYRPNYERESVDLVAITSPLFSDYLQRYNELVEVSEGGVLV